MLDAAVPELAGCTLRMLSGVAGGAAGGVVAWDGFGARKDLLAAAHHHFRRRIQLGSRRARQLPFPCRYFRDPRGFCIRTTPTASSLVIVIRTLLLMNLRTMNVY
jgi:hypothetical protein